MKINSNIPEYFYKEENRDGTIVTESLKKVWAAQMDMLLLVKDVCEKNNITFFLTYGSLLGAIRHGGMIPWDDDIDITMDRENYEKFIKIAPEQFPEGYFFQNFHTEDASHIIFTKIRKEDTTAINSFEKPYNYHFNQGIFLDVFPLDRVPDSQKERDSLLKKYMFWKRQANRWARMFDCSTYHFVRKQVMLLLPLILMIRLVIKIFRIPNIPCVVMEKLVKKYNDMDTKYLSNYFFGIMYLWPVEYFNKAKMVNFEFTEMPVPEGSEDILTRTYGDWKAPVKGGSEHEGVFFDTEKSYKEYIK